LRLIGEALRTAIYSARCHYDARGKF
jgi:hypothetical protein